MIDHVAESQAQYLYNIKNNLQEGEFLVTLDFAENYSFKIQDAVQSYHWSNDQATLHPYVIYHKNGETVVHECFVVISDNNKHDTVAVHLFNKKMLDHIKLIFREENVRRLIFFLTAVEVNIKTSIISRICVITKMISMLKPNGTFLQPLTEKVLVMEWEEP